MDLFSTPDSPRGLAAGTLVTTSDGDKKIEEIKAGDLVLSGIGCGKTGYFEVKEAKSKSYNGPILEITTKIGHKIQATPNHICFGYIPRKDMDHLFQEGNVLIAAFSSLGKNDRIGHSVFVVPHVLKSEEIIRNLDHAEELALAASRTNGGADIYRFATFVGDSRLGTPYYFLPALSLEENQEIPVVKGEIVSVATITNITEEQYDGLVYDLDIPEARNFAANGVLVHDSRS